MAKQLEDLWDNVPGFDPAKGEFRRLDLDRWLKENRVIEQAGADGEQNKPSAGEARAGVPDKIIGWVNRRGRICRQNVSKWLNDLERNLADMEDVEGLEQRKQEVQETLEDAKLDLEGKKKSQRNELAVQQRNAEYEEIAEQQRILREKGQNPPCWYEIVPAANGGTREKAFYLFDIAVFDEHMIVRRRPPPPGGAFDDGGGPYAEEAASLPLEEIRYETPLADMEIVELLEPIFNAGKESSVRTYSCVFFVQVWDETSEFAKERWQQAHDRVLEGLFGTFTVRDEPWQPQ